MQLCFKLRHALITTSLIGSLILTVCSSTPEVEIDETAATLHEAHLAYNAKEYKKVFQLIFPLAANGNARAQYALGYLFYHGLGVEKSDRQSMHWIQRAAAQGNIKAIQALNAEN